MKQYKNNKDEYELKTHLYERQMYHSSDCNIIPLKDIPRCLEQECNIPNDIEPQVKFLAHSYGIDYLGSIKVLLSAISMAICGRLSINQTELWNEPGILQTIAIGESGTMKSSLLKTIAHPFRQFEQDHAVPEEHRTFSKVRQKVGEDFVRAMLKNKLRETIKVAVHSDSTTALEMLGQFANESAKFQIDACTKLNSAVQIAPRLMLDTITPMALARHLQEHGECANIMSAEADFIKKVILDPSADIGLTLRGATQEQYIRPSGNATKEIRLEHPAINMLVMSQYCIAEKLYRNEELNDIGLTARLMPHFFAKYDHIDKYDSCVVGKYNFRIRDLLDQYYTQDSNAEHYAVTLTPGAMDVLDDFSEEIEDILKVKAMPESAAPWLRKACGLALRYALAYHAWRCANPHESDITMDEMLLGVMVVSKSLTHVSFAYSPEGLCAVNTARKIIDSIGNRPEDTYIKLEQVWTSTLIQQRIGRKSVEVNNALKLLEVLNWITLHDEGSNNLKFMLHRDFFRKALP